MNKIEKLTLIEGVFLSEEAKDILMNIFSSKITFHHLKNFSSKELYGKEDETAQKRIPELKKELVKLQSILAEAKEQNAKLSIHSEIIITFADNNDESEQVQ